MTGKEDRGKRVRFDYTDDEVIAKIRQSLVKSNPNVAEAKIRRNGYSGEYDGEYVDEYGNECRFSVNYRHIRSYFKNAMLWLKKDGGAYEYKNAKLDA